MGTDKGNSNHIGPLFDLSSTIFVHAGPISAWVNGDLSYVGAYFTFVRPKTRDEQPVQGRLIPLYCRKRTGMQTCATLEFVFTVEKHGLSWSEYRRRRPLSRSGSRFHGQGTRYDGPEIRFDGPRIRYDGPEIRFDGPRIRYDGPEIRFDSPRIRYDGPEIRFDGPEIRFGGPRIRFDGRRSCFEGLRSCFDPFESFPRTFWTEFSLL